VNDVDAAVFVEHEDHLQRLARWIWTPYEQLVLLDATRIGSPRLLDDAFGCLGFDPVLGDVLQVPLVPPKVHRPSSGSHLAAISSIRNPRGLDA
jgi:hypothetical protein